MWGHYLWSYWDIDGHVMITFQFINDIIMWIIWPMQFMLCCGIHVMITNSNLVKDSGHKRSMEWRWSQWGFLGDVQTRGRHWAQPAFHHLFHRHHRPSENNPETCQGCIKRYHQLYLWFFLHLISFGCRQYSLNQDYAGKYSQNCQGHNRSKGWCDFFSFSGLFNDEK